MENASVYLPLDRRLALASGQKLPDRAVGAVLFADISGFTPLTNLLVQRFGPRRGADELTRQLNAVYSALIAEVDRFGGSVIGFSGDAITCWFAAQLPSDVGAESCSDPKVATLRAVAAALEMQRAIIQFQALTLGPGMTMNLAIKTAVAAGPVQRCLVGNAAIQWIDVLAGATLDHVAATEQMAQKGELLLDEVAFALVQQAVTLGGRRQDALGGRYALVTGLQQPVAPAHLPEDHLTLPANQVKPWILPAVYARLQSDQGRFLAELRPATALFLKFSGLDYDQDAQAPAKLDTYICWVQEVINRYEGALIQLTTGDKGSYLYAAFGAPISHDDDTNRAVAVALDLHHPPAHIDFITSTRIGITRGIMRVGAYGGPTRRTYGVLGEETNIAARLMSLAQPGEILVSQPVAEAIANRYTLHELEPVQLKGRSELQLVYAVGGRKEGDSDHFAKLYDTPLVGRAAQLTDMEQWLDHVKQGRGHILRIEGAAGIGKSHLVASFVRQAAAQGFAIAIAACQSTSQEIAYFAARQIARTLLGLRKQGQSSAEEIAHLEATLTAMNPTWLVRMPLLGELLTLSIPENPTTAAFDPRLRQEALISLAVEIVLAGARRQPLLLVLEDIHWLDEATQRLLMAVGRVVTQAPLLLVLVQRPRTREEDLFLDEVAALPDQHPILLEELPREGVAALVQNRLGGAISSLALALIQAQTQGNPFFTEELVDALVDANHLILATDGWELAPIVITKLNQAGCLKQVGSDWTFVQDAPLGAVDLGMPATVQGIVLARLDRLPDPVKLTIKVASVIGRLFAFDLLAAIHPLQNQVTTLEQHMTLLLGRDFARTESPAPQLVYIFKHNITQEVAYQTLLGDQRQELHQAVATVLEQMQPDRIEDLAFHYSNSDLQREAVRVKTLHYLEAAGQRAKHDYANETALNYFNRALALETRWPWLKAKVEVLHILGRRDEEQTTLELLSTAPQAPSFEVVLLWGEYYESISEYEQARHALLQALEYAQALGDPEREARSQARLGMTAWRQGDYEMAEGAYNAALRIIGDEERFRDEEAEVRYGLGLVYRQQGKYDEAQREFERDLALNRQLPNRQREARSLNELGHIALLRRDFNAAVQYYQQTLDIRQAIGDREGVGAGLLSLAQGLGYLGDHAQAEPMLLEALKIHQAMNNRWWEISAWNELGIVYLMVGEFEKAKHCLSEGLTLSQKIGDKSGAAYTLCNLGQVLREQGELDLAESTLLEGLRLAQMQGDANLEAIYYNDLALVSLLAKRFEEAIFRASLSLEKFHSLELPLSTTTSLTTIAAGQVALHNPLLALNNVSAALKILDQCGGEGPDYPHRDYWVCYQILHMTGNHVEASHALQAAYRLLIKQANRISNPTMRRSYLEKITYNYAILQAAIRAGLGHTPEIA